VVAQPPLPKPQVPISPPQCSLAQCRRSASLHGAAHHLNVSDGALLKRLVSWTMPTLDYAAGTTLSLSPIALIT